MKFRISKIASTFTAEALEIGETLEIVVKIDSEQNFMIFSDSASVLKGYHVQILQSTQPFLLLYEALHVSTSMGHPQMLQILRIQLPNCNVHNYQTVEIVLKGISNSSTTNNISHITQMLKDKIEKLESRGKRIKFYWIPGHCGIEVNERADLEAMQAIKEGRDNPLLLPVADVNTQWTKNGKEYLHKTLYCSVLLHGELIVIEWKDLHSFCQNTKRDREERCFEKYYSNNSAPWFREIKTNLHAFVSINRMRAGHISLKARLNRFNTVSTAECECDDGMQTVEHILWDCKLY
jgi:ribonuclease HI